MMILAAISILFLVSFTILGLNRFNLRPGYFWFLASGATITAWVLILISWSPEPVYYPLMNWGKSTLFFASPGFLLDGYSWPFAVVITTLLTAVMLTDAARVWDIRPSIWGADLAIAGAGLLSVFAANPLTLLLAWATIDLTETSTLLSQLTSSDQREQVVVSFSARIVGILLVIAAIIRSHTLGVNLVSWDVPAAVSGYLILAAGLRLGVLPPHQPFLQEPPLRRGLGTMVRLVPVAASLVLLTRVAEAGSSAEWALGLTIASALALVYGGAGWLFARNELDGRPFWIFGMSSLAVVGAVRGLPSVSQAWGLGNLIAGGLIFLYSTRRPRYLWLPALSLLTISGLPFTPLWRGFSLFKDWNLVFSMVFSLGIAFLLLGYFRHSFSVIGSGDEIESWARVLYPVGLAVLPLVFWGVAWSLSWFHLAQLGHLTVEWWLGAILLCLVSGIWYLLYRGPVRLTLDLSRLQRIFTLRWLYRILWGIYRPTSKLVIYLAGLMEGQGGVFWAVLILILLVTVIVQRSIGG
jgi:hypothetical protein